MDNLIVRLREVLCAAQLCLTNRFQLPVLILIYSVVDIVASLEHQGNEQGTRKPFVRWVKGYLVPGGDLPCTPTELYSARCGVVHALSGESDLSRAGKARRVCYAYGSARPDDLQQVLPGAGRDDVVVHLDSLLALVAASLDRYFAEVRADPERQKIVDPNAAKCFTVITDQDLSNPFRT
jgi:hypothetical protein